MKYRTYTQMEEILRTAFDVEGNSIKDIAEMAGIRGKDIAPPVVIISDGQLLPRQMEEYAITEEWVAATLRQEKMPPDRVFLMTVDENRNYLIIPRDEKEVCA